MSCLPALRCLVVVSLVMAASSMAEEGSPEKGDAAVMRPEVMTKKWGDRERRVQSLRIKWTEQQTFERGSLVNPTEPKRKNPKGLTVPEKQETYTVTYELTIKGNKIRCAKTNAVGVTTDKKIAPQDFLTVSNETVTKTLVPIGTTRYPRGYVGGDKYDPDLIRESSLKPALLLYRPSIVLETSHLSLQSFIERGTFSQDALIGNERCAHWEDTPPGGPRMPKLSFWVKPEQDAVPVRYTIAARGITAFQVLWHPYKKDQDEWIPSGWKMDWLGNDQGVTVSATSTVQTCMINPDVKDEEFDLEFPVGTLVVDRREPPSEYIVKEGGERRIVTKEEDAVPYEDLVKPAGRGRRFWAGVLAVAVPATVVILVLRRRAAKWNTGGSV